MPDAYGQLKSELLSELWQRIDAPRVSRLLPESEFRVLLAETLQDELAERPHPLSFAEARRLAAEVAETATSQLY